MNKAILMGRITKDPDVRSNGDSTVTRFSLAVDRRFKKDNEQTADFIGCVAFGKTAEFVEKYCHKGTKLVVTGRIQTGNYTNKEGQKVYTTDVIVEECEFAESKKASESNEPKEEKPDDGFMNVPDDDTDELPFQ